MTRKALGRGLGALLSAEGTATATEDSSEIPIDLIDPSTLQPRTVFDDAKLDELAQSIRANGVVQPLLLRRKGARYELIAGERRWRAAQRAGLIRIPAVLRNVFLVHGRRPAKTHVGRNSLYGFVALYFPSVFVQRVTNDDVNHFETLALVF